MNKWKLLPHMALRGVVQNGRESILHFLIFHAHEFMLFMYIQSHRFCFRSSFALLL